MCNGKCIRNVVQRGSSQCDSVFQNNIFSPIIVYRLLINRFMMMAWRDCSMSEYGAEVESVQENVHDGSRSGSAQIIKDTCQRSMSAGTGFGKPTTTSTCICWIWVVHQNFIRRCLWRAEISQNVGTLGTKMSGETANKYMLRSFSSTSSTI